MYSGLNNELETLNCLYFKYVNQKRPTYTWHVLLYKFKIANFNFVFANFPLNMLRMSFFCFTFVN